VYRETWRDGLQSTSGRTSRWSQRRRALGLLLRRISRLYVAWLSIKRSAYACWHQVSLWLCSNAACRCSDVLRDVLGLGVWDRSSQSAEVEDGQQRGARAIVRYILIRDRYVSGAPFASFTKEMSRESSSRPVWQASTFWFGPVFLIVSSVDLARGVTGGRGGAGLVARTHDPAVFWMIVSATALVGVVFLVVAIRSAHSSRRG
jgi:hypothetical protein